jgi:hypothetical protein
MKAPTYIQSPERLERARINKEKREFNRNLHTCRPTSYDYTGLCPCGPKAEVSEGRCSCGVIHY